MMLRFLPVLMMMVTLNLANSGRDLLDYMGTDAYWKAKSVSVSTENMLAELGASKEENIGDISPLLKQLGDENYKTRKDAFTKIKALGNATIPQLKAAKDAATDPEVKDACERLIGGFTGAGKAGQVRRLMAIRALGELKDKAALPALQTLVASKDPFIADYASAAIAAINNTPYTRPTANAEARASDVALLPADVGAVMQLTAQGGQTIPLQKIIEEAFKPAKGADVDPDAVQQQTRIITEMNSGILQTAEQIGNVRVDAVTVGISKEIGPNMGYGVIIIRGQYDPTALSPLTSHMTAVTMDGMTVYTAPYGAPTIIPAPDRFIIVAQANEQGTTAQTMVAALKAKKGAFADNAAMAKLIKSVDTTKILWGVAQMSDSYRMAPPLAAFDSLTVTAEAKDGSMVLNVAAIGSDEAKTKTTVEWTNTQIQNGIEETKKMAAYTDVTPIVEFLQTIKVEAKGKDATGTASFKGGTNAIIQAFFRASMGVRTRSRPMPANVQPIPN